MVKRAEISWSDDELELLLTVKADTCFCVVVTHVAYAAVSIRSL